MTRPTPFDAVQPALAIDVQALGALRAQAKSAPDAALDKAATQFEALFMQMMLKSMRDTVSEDGLFDSEATRTYMGMLDQQLASRLSGSSGLGLAGMIVKQLQHAKASGPDAGTARASEPAADATEPGPSVPVDPFAPREPYGATNLKQPSSAAHVHEFIDRIAPYAQAASRDTGVPARFIAAQAALESNWGRNEIRGPGGAPSYNLFGIKATRGWSGKTVAATTTEYARGMAGRTVEPFRAYSSYAEGFADYARLLKARYKDAVAAGDDAVRFAKGLQRSGYASDPHYAEKVARLIQTNFSVKA